MSRAVKSVAAFGWVIAHNTLPAGTSCAFSASQDIAAAQRAWCALYTRGHATMTRQPDRFPGHFTREDIPLTRAGNYTLQAVEDTEWWCMDARLNGGRRPRTLEPIRLSPFESVSLPRGTRVFLVAGCVLAGSSDRVRTAPLALEVDSPMLQLTAADSHLYGFNLGTED